MKGQTQIGGIDFRYCKKDNFLHVKASDIVHQDCILPDEIKSIIDLEKSNELSRLLLNYEEGFVAEILQF